MKRSKSTQSKHDKAVRKIAGGYKSQGWKVHADIPNHSKPRTIYGKIPDVIATKGKQTRIVEVETKSSLKSDVSQRRTFRRFASQSNKRKFRTKVV